LRTFAFLDSFALVATFVTALQQLPRISRNLGIFARSRADDCATRARFGSRTGKQGSGGQEFKEERTMLHALRRFGWAGLVAGILGGTAGSALAQPNLLPRGVCPPSPCPAPQFIVPPSTTPAPPATTTPPAGEGTATAPTPTPTPAPTPTPSVDLASLGGESSVGLGGESAGFGAATGYLDPAIPMSQIRLRFDAAYDNNRPDRAEFFYAKCGCFATLPPNNPQFDPKAPGPRLPESSVDYQDISTYIELASDNRWSVFVNVPYRFLNPVNNANTSGIADMDAGFKAALISCRDRYLTFQFRTYIPTGDSNDGLGTDHVSLEPALLAYQRLTDRLALDFELRDWIPIGGTDFAGNVIRYGFGVQYDIWRNEGWCLTPIGELVGWTVLSGKEFSLAEGIVPAAGDTIVNAKIGARLYMGENNSFYVGYGRALTGEVWYKDIVRVEYRLSF
jgi:hypothetical protein